MKNKTLLKIFALVMLAVTLQTIPVFNLSNTAFAAAKKKKSSTNKKTVSNQNNFNLDKYIQAHKNNNRNAIHEQLAALKGNFRKTFNLEGNSNVNLLMLACYWAADSNSMDAIYTLIDNCPDLINARDGKGQTAIFYALQNNYTLPYDSEK